MKSFPDQEVDIKISLDSRLDRVFLVGAAVRGICVALRMETVAAYQVELAVVEGINNVIKHAYGSEAGHPVELLVAVEGEDLRFEIWDEGKPINGQAGTCLDYNPRDQKNLPEGGMGLHIMEQVMDEINHCRRDGRNCLVLRKRLA